MKFDYDQPWLAKILSLFLAVLLFFYVSYENQNRFQTNRHNNGASVVSSEVLTNLPIEVNIDSNQYFVTGLPDSATLRMEGPQAVLFQTSVTQNFTISTPDLNELGVGEHRINLIANGLSEEISYSISPAEITITIEEKVTREYPVELEMSPDISMAEGYEIVQDEIQVDTQNVLISGALSTLEQIDRVVAYVNPTQENISEDISVAAGLAVLDAAGNPLNVNIDTQQVNVYLPVVETYKAVPIALEAVGEKADNYKLSLDENENKKLKVKGESAALDQLNNWTVQVDISNIDQPQVVDVPIGDLPEGIEAVDREKIRVNIELKN